MEVSMNGLRKNMARDFNKAVSEFRELRSTMSHLSDSVNDSLDRLGEHLSDLRSVLGGLLGCFDPEDKNFDDLSETVKLSKISDEDEE